MTQESKESKGKANDRKKRVQWGKKNISWHYQMQF